MLSEAIQLVILFVTHITRRQFCFYYIPDQILYVLENALSMTSNIRTGHIYI